MIHKLERLPCHMYRYLSDHDIRQFHCAFSFILFQFVQFYAVKISGWKIYFKVVNQNWQNSTWGKTITLGLAMILSCDNLPFESAHDKTYYKTCATSEDSDQPAHPRSLIRVSADRMSLLQPQGYPRRDKREPLPYWVDVQADLNLCW